MARPLLRSLSLLVLVALGCGGDDGDDGDPQPRYECPTQLPAVAGACDEVYATCTYMNCDSHGVTTATCRDDRRWDLSSAACGEVFCEQETCAPGFICVRTVAGFPSGMCVENSCGEGPIGCECPGCGDLPCSSYGLTIECNACSGDICP